MNDGRLHLDLEAKLDKNGKKYYVAKLDCPVILDCSKGLSFLIFVSEEGSEELQIAHITKPKINYQVADDRS